VNEKLHGVTPGNLRIVVIAGALWAACLLMGFAVLAVEEFTPAQTTATASDFPAGSQLTLASDKPTLLLFLHPHCPCSRATLTELEKLLATTQDKVATTIIFTIPPGTPPGWEKGDLWNRAQTIPGARVWRDENGVAARQFGVVGSGHTLLYSSTGRLLFSGGITPSRGEEGDNPGETAIADLVLRGHAAITRTPVFGCTLL
jgi:hypothetical protein